MIIVLKYFGFMGFCGVALALTGCVGSISSRSVPVPVQIAVEQGLIPDTVQRRREAVQRNPQEINTRLSLAIALQDSGETEEAEQELWLALEHDPQNALACNLLGDLYMEWGKKTVQTDTQLAEKRLDAAAAQFEKSIQLARDPNLLIAALLGTGATYEELGKLYLQQKSPEKATAAKEKARSAFGHLIKVCPECEQQLKIVAIERAWPRSGFSSAYKDFHLISFEARIKRVQDEISKIRR